MSSRSAWRRRPSSAVTRLRGRSLLLLSTRDLLRAARAEDKLLVAFVAPSLAAMSGFARAARELGAPLLLVRPSGHADERGPGEARDDGWFAEAAMRAAVELRFSHPMALLKDPPRAGATVPEQERVRGEIEAGFTGVSIAARVDEPSAARDAALSAAEVCRLDLGLEVVPLGGSAEHAIDVARGFAARGSPPSALRITGHEMEAGELIADMPDLAFTTANEASPEKLVSLGLTQLTASGPFLRALHQTATPLIWDQLQAWADERQASLEQAAAHHQRLLREMPASAQEKLEALCYFEGAELLSRCGAEKTGDLLATYIGRAVETDR